MRRQETVKQIG